MYCLVRGFGRLPAPPLPGKRRREAPEQIMNETHWMTSKNTNVTDGSPEGNGPWGSVFTQSVRRACGYSAALS